MGQRVTSLGDYSERGRKTAERLATEDVRDQIGVANLVGGGQESVIIPEYAVDGNSETADVYQTMRERAKDGGDPERLGREFGEIMNATEMYLARTGDTTDMDVAVAFPDGSVRRESYDNVLNGSDGNIQDLMCEWAKDLEREMGASATNPTYEMARNIDDEIPWVEGL